MKLRFLINYATQWGESLHVRLCLTADDGTQRSLDLIMLTQDGQSWSVETAVVESRQRRFVSLSYHYEVADQEGHLLRREWTVPARVFPFNSSVNMVFADQWCDRPLCSHLYTTAYEVAGRLGNSSSGRMGAEPSVAPIDIRRSTFNVPFFRRTLVFRVSAPQLGAGQSLALVGSHPVLGAWSEQRYLPMQQQENHVWMLAVNAEALQLPVDYKYVVVDNATNSLKTWEEGDNRTTGEVTIDDGQAMVLDGQLLHLKEEMWRAAGVAIAVSALRSEHSCGVGDFGDLKRLVDWVHNAGMKVIQLLPVNDTTTDGHWHDSHPYNIVSAFALHPHYMNLEALPPLADKQAMVVFRRRQRELNAQKHYDYEAVGRVKGDYLRAVFAEQGEQLLNTTEFKSWYTANKHWIDDYVKWRITQCPSLLTSDLLLFSQYHLHCQLLSAANYARSKGVVLKGDLPVGVNGCSVETALHPAMFNLDAQTGAPPDATNPRGQNWGFPTYNWDNEELATWLRRRIAWMAQYFDAVRIDHVLGFFRIWEIPAHSVSPLMGHFSPSLPLTIGEIEHCGLPFRRELLTQPFINDRVLDRLFGIHAEYVRQTFLERRSYGLYALKTDYDTQRKVCDYFSGLTDENSLWIKEGLMQLVANVLFVEDPRQHDMFHPRIAAWHDAVFDALTTEEKEAYMRLYNNYYYQRHNMFWGNSAVQRLDDVFGTSRLLLCAEDLGMLPQCVAPVLDHLRILTLEVQSMPKLSGQEFAHLEGNPVRSVATISTHDMPPLRLWWQENPERAQHYYATMLQKQGRAPEQLPPHLAEEIVARHLYCPSMLCILSLQDWLAIDATLRGKNPRDERLNTPSDPYNRWEWRMHITLEQLSKASQYINKVRTMIVRSRR